MIVRKTARWMAEKVYFTNSPPTGRGTMKPCLCMFAPALLAVLFSPFTVFAQAYPSRIVRVVIPWPGGSNDAAGRLVFQKIAESVGQPVVIENRSGAAGRSGAALV